MEKFKPTWLYIKEHNVTGLKYFGKTIKNDVDTYKGSGLVWSRHLKKHSNNVSTIWKQLFLNQDSLKEFASNFSIKNNIVESKSWANLRLEDGLMGGDTGITKEGRKKLSIASSRRTHTEKTKEKIRAARKKQKPTMLGKRHSEETKLKIKKARAEQIFTEETKRKISEKLKGNTNAKKVKS